MSTSPTIGLTPIGTYAAKVGNSQNAPMNTRLALQALEENQGNIASVASSTQSAVANLNIPQSLTLDVVLIASSGVTTITFQPPQNPGDLLHVFIQAAGTGASFAFNGFNFGFVAENNFNSSPGTWTVIPFVARMSPVTQTLKWYRTGIFLTGEVG